MRPSTPMRAQGAGTVVVGQQFEPRSALATHPPTVNVPLLGGAREAGPADWAPASPGCRAGTVFSGVTESEDQPTFHDLGLGTPVLRALTELGYEVPSPIQVGTIPALLEGRDVVGLAQTGTGKTAAFALPILSRIDARSAATKALVLAPTRALVLQVAAAFGRYAHHRTGLHVLPVYGGQAYAPQLAGIRRGAQVVVGTPGRVIDHLERGTLDLGGLRTLVLDEADEMLRMGF